MSAATKRLRAAVFKRALNCCECGCGRWVDEEAGQMDHQAGRARTPQSLANCWALAVSCHEAKTNGNPSAAWWLERFAEHCRKHNYSAELERVEARLEFVRARGAA